MKIKLSIISIAIILMSANASQSNVEKLEACSKFKYQDSCLKFVQENPLFDTGKLEACSKFEYQGSCLKFVQENSLFDTGKLEACSKFEYQGSCLKFVQENPLFDTGKLEACSKFEYQGSCLKFVQDNLLVDTRQIEACSKFEYQGSCLKKLVIPPYTVKLEDKFILGISLSCRDTAMPSTMEPYAYVYYNIINSKGERGEAFKRFDDKKEFNLVEIPINYRGNLVFKIYDEDIFFDDYYGDCIIKYNETLLLNARKGNGYLAKCSVYNFIGQSRQEICTVSVFDYYHYLNPYPSETVTPKRDIRVGPPTMSQIAPTEKKFQEIPKLKVDKQVSEAPVEIKVPNVKEPALIEVNVGDSFISLHPDFTDAQRNLLNDVMKTTRNHVSRAVKLSINISCVASTDFFSPNSEPYGSIKYSIDNEVKVRELEKSSVIELPLNHSGSLIFNINEDDLIFNDKIGSCIISPDKIPNVLNGKKSAKCVVKSSGSETCSVTITKI